MKNLLLLLCIMMASTAAFSQGDGNGEDPPPTPPTNWTAAVIDGDTDSCDYFCASELIPGELTFYYDQFVLNGPVATGKNAPSQIFLTIQVKNMLNTIVPIKDKDEATWKSSVTSVPFIYSTTDNGWVCSNPIDGYYTIQASGSYYTAHFDVDVSVPNPDFYQYLYDCDVTTPPFSCDESGARKAQVLLNDEVEFNMYPNPVNDLLNIEIQSMSQVDYKASVSDLHGSVLWQGELNADETNFSISTSDFPSGIYLLFIENNMERKQQLFIKTD